MSICRRVDVKVIVPLLLAVWLGLPVTASAQTSLVDTQMYDDPKIPLGQITRVLPPRLIPLWLQALERPESDYKRQAAAAIALGHQRKVPGLDVTVAPLLRVLDMPEQELGVRLAVAQALIELDARQAAPALLAHSRSDGIDMLNLVEPALARWNYDPVKPVWLDRLRQPGLAARSWIVALQGLATVHETKAVPRLHELITAATIDPIVQLESAKTLGTLETTGLEKEAERLAQGTGRPGDVRHLAAAYLLLHHRSDAAAKLQERLAMQPEPAAALVALRGLLEYDPGRVLALVDKLARNSDAEIRAICVEAFARRPAASQLPQIADLLDDVHPVVRTRARKTLAATAKKAEFRQPIQQQVVRVLSSNGWRGLEQATLLVAELDVKSAAPRVVQLLQFNRPEVFIAAAWCLRKLAVPASYAAQLQEIERRYRDTGRKDLSYPRLKVDEEVAQLCESLGAAHYAAAVPALLHFVPKQVSRRMGTHSRIAAIWALGILLQKSPPEDLIKSLAERLTDLDPNDPEDTDVRVMCAITLGRMKAKAAADDLQSCFPRRLSPTMLPCACAWALEQITGEKSPESDPIRIVETGWFLEPDR
jgi:hypothetical protein